MRYTPAQARSLAAVPASPGWFTLAELGKGATASALTRLAMRDDPPVERRMARWGGETGQTPGRGYEYRLTALGLAERSGGSSADTRKTDDAADDDHAALAALQAMLSPATRKVEVQTMPPVRRKICAKCPFGDGLTAGEQVQADALKARLAAEPQRLWGCHETIDGRPQICAGFAATRPDLFDV